MEPFRSTIAPAHVRWLRRISTMLLITTVLVLSAQVAGASPLTTAFTSSASSLALDPLDSKIGGSRDSFEAAYGKPTDAGAYEYPFGEPYVTDGAVHFGEGLAYAFFEDDRLIYLTLVPKYVTWGEMELYEALTAFLPPDAVAGGAKDVDGALVTFAHSDELTTAVDADVYDEYDISGEPGDFYVRVRLSPDNDMTIIEFALGSSVQSVERREAGDADGRAPSDVSRDTDGDRPSNDASNDQNASDVESEYLAAVTAGFESLTDSIDRFDVLIQDPDFGDERSLAELNEIFIAWTMDYQDAKSLSPPRGFEDVHARYLAFSGFLSDAVAEFADGDAESAAYAIGAAEEQAAVLS